MSNELSVRELESEMAVVLPEREALSGVKVSIHQYVHSFNVDTYNTYTYANANVWVFNVQAQNIIIAPYGG